MPKIISIAKRVALARKINDLLGADACKRLHEGLTDDEYNNLSDLFGQFAVCLHNDGYMYGFCINTRHGWTSEGHPGPRYAELLLTD